MQPETLLAYVRAEPFRPFRVTRTDGKTYDVLHPRFVQIGRDFFHFYYKKEPDGPYDRAEFLGLEVLVKVEHLDALPTPTGTH